MACCRRPRTAAWALVLVLAPFEAQAHLANLRFGDFYGGLLHPLTTPAQALALIALALLLGQQGPSRARWALPMLPPALVVGALAPWLLATTHPGCKLVWIDALALMIPALLVVLAVRLPILVPVLVAVFIGLVIGRANGMEFALLPRDEPLVANRNRITDAADRGIERRLGRRRLAVHRRHHDRRPGLGGVDRRCGR